MSKYIIQDTTLADIADAIREKTKKTGAIPVLEMAAEIEGISSGGDELSFEVVGNPQPSNPQENTIWIDTDTEITRWIFSATEPELPTEGNVWIQVNVSSHVAFNILNNNVIQVYPFSAKQYVNGMWTDVFAHSYQNGEWVDWWNGDLYVNNNQFELITGGWVNKQAFTWQGKYNFASTTEEITFDGDMIFYAGDNRATYATTVNTIDLTNFTELHCEVTQDTATDAIFVHTATSGTLTSVHDARLDLSAGVNVLPISELNGEYYISVGVADDHTIRVNNIRLV